MNVERLTRRCESPACSYRPRSWRAWLAPQRGYALDGHWYCSMTCFEQALSSVIAELLRGAPHRVSPSHRIPLGLLMLSRGLVDNEQLKRALQAQKDSGSGRVGEWLRHIGAVTEEQVTQALGVQWCAPVFPLNQSRRYLECAHLVPFPLLELSLMVPVHHVRTSQQLYLAFVDRINYSALYAMDKILQCHTEPCLAVQSQIAQALNDLRDNPRSVEVLVDNITDSREMAGAISAQYDYLTATDVRVSGFDGFVWARLLTPSGYTDMLFQPQKSQTGLLMPAEQA
jgi:hypothetical protein